MSATSISIVLWVVLLGQAANEPPVDGERQERLKVMKEKAAALALYRGPNEEAPLAVSAEPVLRYSNAEREIGSLDGAMFLWLEATRPIAAASFSVRRVNNQLYCECTSFNASPLESRGAPPNWSPQRGGLLRQPLPDAPAPADSKPQRLTQMRNAARRFTATCHNSRTEDPTELRLLPQPLYRFSDEKSHVVDGGLFAFVVSNDPELLLLLEAVSQQAGSEPRWCYSLARMSSLKETIKLDDKVIWTVPNFYRDPTEDRKTGPYIEARIGTFIAGGGTP